MLGVNPGATLWDKVLGLGEPYPALPYDLNSGLWFKSYSILSTLWGNPTDKVLDHVTKTKFHFKIMKFVANFEKIVLGFYNNFFGDTTIQT